MTSQKDAAVKAVPGVSGEMVERALMARVPGGSQVWVWLPQEDAWTPHQTARDVMRCALEAALSAALPLASVEQGGMYSDELEPGQLRCCPFCGGEAEKIELTDEANFGGSVICCKKCGASSPVHFDRKENLEDSWNHRVSVEQAGRSSAVAWQRYSERTDSWSAVDADYAERLREGGERVRPLYAHPGAGQPAAVADTAALDV